MGILNIITFSPNDPHLALMQKLNPGIRPEQIAPHATCYVAIKNAIPEACLTTQLLKSSYAIIGHYEALNAEAGIALLKRVQQDLKVSTIIGPMNGSTWERYRFALLPEAGQEIYTPPTFFGEPRNPPEYPSHFLAAGFTVAEYYESRILDDLLIRENKRKLLQKRTERLGITTASIDLANYDREIFDIYTLSSKAFTKNPFYQPITFDLFKKLYENIRPYLDPDFILLARNANQDLLGYTFAYPDLESIIEEKPTRLILKTIAVSEKALYSGLAIYMIDTICFQAHIKGYKSIIEALMHADNVSKKIAKKAHTTKLFKRYALYQWKTNS